MSDGVDITPGTGAKVLTDDTGAGGHAQVVKLATATNGDGTLVEPASQATLASVLAAVDTLETLIAATNTALSTIDGRVDGVESLLTTLNGLVDGLEALIGTTNSSLTTINGNVDGLEALLATQAGYLDGLETLITASNTKLDSVVAAVDQLEGYLDTVESLLGSGKTLQFAEIDRATSGAVVAAAGSSTKIYVVSYALIVTSDVTVEWRSASTGISGAMALKAGGGVSASGSLQTPLFSTAANEALNIQLGSGVQTSGHVAYYTGA